MVVLSLACEEPMHPYRMQALIKQRGKDRVANVSQRNSVYQTIDALVRAGLIAVRGTSREERRPERTVYEATDEGRRVLRTWIREGLATVAREFPEFPAVLSLPDPTLRPEETAALLDARRSTLEARLREVQSPPPGLPRIFLLEDEYMAAIYRAEISWLRHVSADLRSGDLRFPSKAEMLKLARTMGGPSEEAIGRVEKELAAPKRGKRPRASGEGAASGEGSRRRARRARSDR
jgi:DNA-binding PadR family transcriptional regulator